jgi:phosphopantothenoylcysteine decarboxylase/phosphopantothenate--cysteine ligase
MGRPYKKRLRFLIAFGPTQEPIDPVRFLSNYSTGVLGRCLVAAAKKRGHRVESVECPTRAQTARELDRLMWNLLPKSDVLVMAAAVADVRPAKIFGHKIKKNKLRGIRFVKNPDILSHLAKRKKRGQVFVGFGLESEKLAGNGAEKLRRKSLELIVLQKVTQKNKPFGNKAIDALLMDRAGKKAFCRSITKDKLARILIRRAERIFASKNRD